jgi:hypothetical protein
MFQVLGQPVAETYPLTTANVVNHIVWCKLHVFRHCTVVVPACLLCNGLLACLSPAKL